MNDIEFFNNFSFTEFKLKNIHHRDNTHGIERHFIGYMKKGRGILTGIDRTVYLEKNDLFYIPKGCKYRSCWIGDDTVIFDSIGFNDFPTEHSSGYTLQKIEYTPEILECYRPFSESKEINVASIGRLYTLLGMIEPLLERSEESKVTEIVQRAIRMMHENHMKSIPEYAHACDISESLLYLYFKQCSGETPNDARRRIACEKAVNLLISSNLPIEKICDITGFSSSSYFRKVLYKYTKKTPSQIRKHASAL